MDADNLALSRLLAIMPRCPPGRAKSALEFLNAAMLEFGINTPKRAAAFLAQVAHESGELRWFEELANGDAYEGREDLGNRRPGDGRLYKGRGPIQLTGRNNYRDAGQALSLPLEKYPEWVAQLSVGFRVAAWFWQRHGLNELADRGDFDGITKAINGGLNGKSSRDAYYAKALQVLT